MTNREYACRVAYLKQENAKHSCFPVLIEQDKWPEVWIGSPDAPDTAYRSRDFLITLHRDSGCIRMSVSRTMINRSGEWLEGISWDELMDLKRHIGFGESYAVEVFPRDSDTVNVVAMRHLWILREPLAIGWFRKKP